MGRPGLTLRDRLLWAAVVAGTILGSATIYLALTLPALPAPGHAAPRPPRAGGRPGPGRAAPARQAGDAEEPPTPTRAFELRAPPPSRFSRGAQRRRDLVFARAREDGAFTRLGEPEPGDWLWAFREEGETVEEYRQSVVNRKLPSRKTLHLLPFADLEPRHLDVLKPIREHAALYFDTEVVILPTEWLDRSWYSTGRGQYNADRIVTELADKVRPDSLGLFGLMGSDLYSSGLNFVFGLALLHDRAGVYSLHRYGSERPALLRRALKLSVHEIGHLFGLQHCVFYRCAMCGGNSLAEMERHPLHVCPVCEEKLAHNLKFDGRERYRKLEAFYRRVGMAEEASFAAARVAPQRSAAAAGP